MVCDVMECENVLIDEGYIVVRPEEKIFFVKKFGKVWAIISNEDKEAIKEQLDKISSEAELRRMFYCEEAILL